MPFKERLLGDSLSSVLSVNAARHLREARVARVEGRGLSSEALRARLERLGVPSVAALVELEARVGGVAFPGGRMLGAGCFLEAHPELSLKDLPRLGGAPLFPIFGDPEHLADWESPFAMMSPTGSISIYDAPHGPAPAFSSLEQLLELEALAPMSPRLHTVRVDAACGELVAELLGATPLASGTGDWVAAFCGDDLWVKELRTSLQGEGGWCGWHGTFLLSERLEALLEVLLLLRDAGYGLGHRGPTSEAPGRGEPVLTFVDQHPELGFRAEVEVTVWRDALGCSVTHRVQPCGLSIHS